MADLLNKRGGRIGAAARRGFSLVELLVVLGIIAVVISLLLPALNRARQQSKAIACQSNLRQIGQAMIIYANNNNGWLFPTGGIEYTDVRTRWFIYVLKPRPPLDKDDTSVQDWTPPIMLCPADQPLPEYEYHSYLLNNHILERNIRYSSKLPGGITKDRAVMAGEKKTIETHYFVETYNDGTSSYDEQVELYRHGVKLGSNYLYMDLHVDRDGPIAPDVGSQNDPLGRNDPWDFPAVVGTTMPTTQPG